MIENQNTLKLKYNFSIFQDGKKVEGKILKKYSEKLYLVEIINESLQREEKIGRLVNSWIEI